MLSAMRGLGFGNGEIDEIFSFLAAILLIGNLTFKPTRASAATDPGCTVEDSAAADRVAGCWGVTAADLEMSVTSHSIEVRGEVLQGKLRPAEALDGCAAAAKHVYGAVFAHLVRQRRPSTP